MVLAGTETADRLPRVEWMQLMGAGWQLVKRWRSLGVGQQGAELVTIAIDSMEEDACGLEGTVAA